MRFRATIGAAASAAAVLVLAVPVPAVADSGHERELEKQILELERRITLLEARTDRRNPQHSENLPRKARPSSVKEPKTDTGASPKLTQGEKPVPRTQSGDKAAAQAQTTTTPTAQTQADEKPQELQTFRENAVTVNAHQIEIETDVGYQRNQTSLQNDRVIFGGTSIRYGVLNWLEIGAQIPYGLSYRTTMLSPTYAPVYSVKGFGDASLQANAQVLPQSAEWPGVVLSLATVFPTGHSPYQFANYQLDQPGFAPTPNPTDVLRDAFSRGVWALRANIQMYKTVDPVILFWGVGVEYPFATQMSGFTVRPGNIYTYNVGASVAFSEKTTVGFTLLGSYQDNMQVNGRRVSFSQSEPILARLTLIQRLWQSWYVEPSFALGLTSDAPNIAANLAVRHRF